MITRLEDKELKRQSRRQLLKLAPVAALGVFAFPKVSDWLVAAGVRFSEWASGALFRSQHLAPTFSDSEVAPLAKFPYNGYDVLDPEVDFEKWTLTVEGDVQRPGEYKLSQIQTLPKVNQNTRHICVEGWDVIGSFVAARASRTSSAWWERTAARVFWRSSARTITTSRSTWPRRCIRSRCSVTRCMGSRSIAGTARRFVCRCRPSWDTSRPSI